MNTTDRFQAIRTARPFNFVFYTTLSLIVGLTVCLFAFQRGDQAPLLSTQKSQPIDLTSPKIGEEVQAVLTANEIATVVVALRQTEATTAVLGNLPQLQKIVTATQNRVLSRLAHHNYVVRQAFQLTPMLALEVDAAAVAALASDEEVLRIDIDSGGQGSLSSAIPLLDADVMHAYGLTGEGIVVAVLDTGIDSDHPDLQGSLIHEACFLDTDGVIDGVGRCPNGSDRQFGAGAAEDDSLISHGSLIAGVITSDGQVASQGMAPNAEIVAIKVMDYTTDYVYNSEIVAALEYILLNLPEVNLINLSLYLDLYTGVCDTADASMISMAAVFDTLKANGVLAFAATGNDFSSTQIGGPACLSSVIAVGGSDLSLVDGVERLLSFGNSNAQTDILAPGNNVVSTGIGGGVLTTYGTSISTPFVVGCAALLMEAGITDPDEIKAFLVGSNVQLLNYASSLSFPRLDCDIQRYHVDPDATGAATGLSWTDAFTNVQDALTQVNSYSEIWVAEGVYYPDVGSGQTADAPASTFALDNQVHLYGGFVGTETVRTERDPHRYVTILSGDIGENDTNIDGNDIVEFAAEQNGENAYHVVSTVGGSGSATLDGFTITAGQALTTAVPMGNIGGGLLLTGTLKLALNDLTFRGNQADYGGGIYCAQAATMSEVVLSGNVAQHDGGGAYIACGLSGSKTDFRGNHAIQNGGGLFVSTLNTLQLINSELSGNAAGNDGGGMAVSGTAVLNHVSLNGNAALGEGGALNVAAGSTLLIENSIVWGNGDNSGSGTPTATVSAVGATSVISGSVIQASGGSGAGWSTAMGSDGGGNLASDPMFVVSIDPSVAPTTTARLILQPASAAIDVAGLASCAATDARGVLRPQVAACNLGLFERIPLTATIALTANQTALIVDWTETLHDQYQLWSSTAPYTSFAPSQNLGKTTEAMVNSLAGGYYQVVGIKGDTAGESSETFGVFQFALEPGS